MTRLVFNRDGGKTDEYGHLLALSRMFSGEVITGLTVAQNGTPNMTVNVATGVGQIPTGTGATAYAYYVGTDATENVTIATADGSNPRRDFIVAYVDKGVAASTGVTNNSNNMLKIVAVAGVPATVPADPTVPQIQTAIGASNPYIILARVRVATATTTITNTNIDNIQTSVSLAVQSSASDGWLAAEPITYAANNGNKEYTLTMVGDRTTKYWPGMKFKTSRGTTPPTQCADFEVSSSQYASKASPTGISFTDDFTVEAWIAPESYNSTPMSIYSRRDGSGNGWEFRINESGQVSLLAMNANTYKEVISRQSVPLGIWTHVAATMDMSGSTGTVYVNGQLIASTVGASGTPTLLVQAGPLQLSGFNGTSEMFDGKVTDARLWSAIRTQTEIQSNMNQQLVGTETNLVGYYKLNGNFTDSTANANNLTANGGVTALNSDNPMKATEYGIITKVSYSAPNTTITLFTGTDYNLPNQALTAPYYSTQQTPYGYPQARNKWRVLIPYRADISATVTNGVWANTGALQVACPTGEFRINTHICAYLNHPGGAIDVKLTVSTTNSTEDDVYYSDYLGMTTLTDFNAPLHPTRDVTNSSKTTFYINNKTNGGTFFLFGARARVEISADCMWA